MGSCHMCGKCCEAIHIDTSIEKIEEQAKLDLDQGFDDTESDALFIHKNWNQITREEAFKINPHFSFMESNGVDYSQATFFTCQHYDHQNKTCTIHEIAPKICSGYPWYNGVIRDTETFYTLDCGYIEDVKDTWWDDMVMGLENVSESL